MYEKDKEINQVTLSKSAYDSMRGTNDRANMLLSRITETITIEDDTDKLHIDEDVVLTVIRILYPETYKKKVSALKVIRTKNFMKCERT